MAVPDVFAASPVAATNAELDRTLNNVLERRVATVAAAKALNQKVAPCRAQRGRCHA